MTAGRRIARPIPDTPENVARAIMKSPPKRNWRFMGVDTDGGWKQSDPTPEEIRDAMDAAAQAVAALETMEAGAANALDRRDILLLATRRSNPGYWTWAKLAKAFDMDSRSTAMRAARRARTLEDQDRPSRNS